MCAVPDGRFRIGQVLDDQRGAFANRFGRVLPEREQIVLVVEDFDVLNRVLRIGEVGIVESVDATVEDARGAARVAALRALAYLQQQIGSLDQVHGVMRLTGYVSCGPGVTDTPHVIDAASDVLTTAFGERGRHARSAVGVSSLPGGALVEVELIVALESVAGDER